MKLAYLLLLLPVLAAGCVETRKPVEERPEGQASNTRAVLNCETNNDPARCVDMRYKAADSYVKALEADYEDSPSRNLKIMVGMSEQYDLLIAKQQGKAYDPPGGRPFKPFDDIAVVQTAAAQTSGTGHCELVNGPKGCSEDNSASTDTSAPDAPTPTYSAPEPEYIPPPAPATSGGSQDGTWYCDNLTGSGNYGTWEMTQHPEQFDVASCKRVD